MKSFTKRRWVYVLIAMVFVACDLTDKDPDKSNPGEPFEISGTITNSNATIVYLEEVGAGSSQGTIEDSSLINKDGKYKLKGHAKETVVYNIRLGQNSFPLAAVINDVPSMTLNVELSKENNQFAEKYEVKGSPVSQEMKDFMYTFNTDLQKIYVVSQQMDSIHKKDPSDSLLTGLIAERKQLGDRIKDFSINALNRAKDPALFLFELGYYQSTANGFGLEPVDIEQVNALINDAVTRSPAHQGLRSVKTRLDEQLAQMKQSTETKWVGKEAPDFSLPDPNGKQVKLSSFRGKYVFVDFWASWCGPCRAENPNVVKAYHKFKDKNFAMLGVSLDNPGEKDRWLNAVVKDDLSWTQVSDLKGWQSVVVPIYDFGQAGIPYNILVDPGGIIIAERLRGAALEMKLGEVLK